MYPFNNTINSDSDAHPIIQTGSKYNVIAEYALDNHYPEVKNSTDYILTYIIYDYEGL